MNRAASPAGPPRRASAGRPLAVLAVLLALLVAAPAGAQLEVGCNPDPAARAGELAAAVAASLGQGARTIALAPRCTYVFTAAFAGDTALPVVQAAGGLSSQLTIDGNGAVIERDQNEAPPFRLLRVDAGGTLTLNDLNLRQGSAPPGADGGAILAAGRLVVMRSNLEFNTAGFGLAGGHGGRGGAIYSTAELQVLDSFLNENRAGTSLDPGGDGGSGGGIYHDPEPDMPDDRASLVVHGTRFSDNSAGSTGDGRRADGTRPRGGAGGAIASMAHVLVEGCFFDGNNAGGGGSEGFAGTGGAISHAFGNLTLTDSTIADSFVRRGLFADGAALEIFAVQGERRAVVRNTRFANNRAGEEPDPLAASSLGGSGAAMLIFASTVEISDSLFVSNHAGRGRASGGFGGAIYSFGAPDPEDADLVAEVTITRSTFLRQRAGDALGGDDGGLGAGGDGGAIFNDLGSTLLVTESTFADNRAGHGGSGSGDAGGSGGRGGAILNRSTAAFVNSTFSGNTAGDGGLASGVGGAGGSGGAVFTTTLGDTSLQSVTIARNAAGAGAAGGAGGSGGGLGGDAGSTFDLASSIVALNEAPAGGANCGAPPIVAGGNVQFPGTDCGATIPSADPRLGELAANGGPTETIALLPGSAAIDAALSAICPPTDQRGVARPANACDAGAFEVVRRLVPIRRGDGTLARIPVPLVR
jgi:hypothetical protein